MELKKNSPKYNQTQNHVLNNYCVKVNLITVVAQQQVIEHVSGEEGQPVTVPKFKASSSWLFKIHSMPTTEYFCSVNKY